MSKINLIVVAVFAIVGCTRGQANEEPAPAPAPPPPAEVESTPAEVKSTPSKVEEPASVPPLPELQSSPKEDPVVIQPPMEVAPEEPKVEIKPEATRSERADAKTAQADTGDDAKEKTPTDLPMGASPLTQTPGVNSSASPPELAAASSENGDRIRSTLKPDDQVSEYFVSALTETDLPKAGGFANQYAVAVLEDPETVVAKVGKTQMAIRQLAEADIYDEATAKRVAYIQSVLDRRVQENRDFVLVRDGVLIAAASVIVGVASGFRPLTRLVHTVDDGGVASARAVVTETAQVDLRALGVSASDVGDLGLTHLRKKINELPMDQFQSTQIPGVRWALLDTFEGQKLNNGRVLVLHLDPFDKRGVFASSRILSPEEARAMQLRLESAGLDPALVSASLPSAKPLVTVAEDTSRKFRVGRALAFAAGSGIGFAGFYSRGYLQGQYYGEQDHLFLESLLPPDKLRQVQSRN